MTLAAIAVRVGSKRFPRKCFADLNGKTLIERVIERVKLCNKVDQIVLACGTWEDNKELVKIGGKYDISCYFKPDGMLIEEYQDLAASCDNIVRITGDCPLIDPWVVDDVIKRFKNCDLSTNVLWPRTFPKGLDVEVINLNTLDRLYKESKGEDRQHITLHIYKHPEKYRIQSLTSGGDWARYNFCVDTPDDLEKVKKIYTALDERVIPWREMIRRVYGE